jgi:hypothetical protein
VVCLVMGCVGFNAGLDEIVVGNYLLVSLLNIHDNCLEKWCEARINPLFK